MSEKNLNRRDFLLRLSALGAFSIGSGTLLAACGGGGEQPQAASEAPAEAPATASAGCNDLSGLSETDRAQSQQMRQSLQYVDESPVEGKMCSNCALWVAPEEGAACGGCTLIKGPISPNGYCTSWAPKQA
ncbi:MAG: high-potential iron-sulfur protein [Rhodothermaceae bacterium]|nr:MAG: high-potential iron-sulfur protein [Rhodothermaceae bacterium]